MMKVKTLVESVEKGYEEALKKLDEGVNKLGGEIDIKNITDYFYPEFSQKDELPPRYITRVIVYDESKKWKATLDTDIMEFLAHEPRISNRLYKNLKYMYKQETYNARKDRTIEIRTLGNLIMDADYGDFKNLGSKSIGELNKIFKEYGLQTLRL